MHRLSELLKYKVNVLKYPKTMSINKVNKELKI